MLFGGVEESPPENSGLDRQWLERLQATSKAQARYLWLLLVIMIFYAALLQRTLTVETSLKVPFVDIEIDGRVLLGVGPALISFMVLATMGALRAYSTARKQLGQRLGGGTADGEELDTSLNAIDLAFYTTPATPKFLRAIAHFSYQMFLLLGVAEAAWMALRLVDAAVPHRWGFVVVGALLWTPAAWLVFWSTYRRARTLKDIWRGSR